MPSSSRISLTPTFSRGERHLFRRKKSGGESSDFTFEEPFTICAMRVVNLGEPEYILAPLYYWYGRSLSSRGSPFRNKNKIQIPSEIVKDETVYSTP